MSSGFPISGPGALRPDRAPARLPARALPLLALLVLVGCREPGSSGVRPHAPPSEDRPAAAGSAPLPGRADAARTESPPASRLDRMRWPPRWHVTDQGRFAAGSAEVAWVEVEADAVEPEEAARSALEVLEAALGTPDFAEVVTSRNEPSRALAHLRASGAAAVVEAERRDRLTLVRVTLQELPPAPPATTP